MVKTGLLTPQVQIMVNISCTSGWIKLLVARYELVPTMSENMKVEVIVSQGILICSQSMKHLFKV